MIEQKFDSIFISLTGKAVLLELKIKLLLNRDKNKVKEMSCSKVKGMMYNKYSEYFDKKDKKIIEDAISLRNQLVHFELHKIFKKQKSIPSKVILRKVKPEDSVRETMKKMSEREGNPIDEDSPLYGQYVELSNNPERIKLLDNLLDKAIKIITRITETTALKKEW